MISLPPGFDAALLASELYTAAGPFVSLGFLIACGMLLIKILNR